MSKTQETDASSPSLTPHSPQWIIPKRLKDLQKGVRVLYEGRTLGTVVFFTEASKVKTHNKTFPSYATVQLDGSRYGVLIYEHQLSCIRLLSISEATG